MAGLSIIVCLPPDATADVVGALDVALAPFEAYQGYPAERDQWESWRIAGGNDGHGFHIRPGAEDDPRLIHDQPHWSLGEQPSMPGMCTGGPRGLLDLTSAGAAAEVAAGQIWDLFHQLRDELPPALPMEHFAQLPRNQIPYVPIGRDEHGGFKLLPDPGRQQAGEQYRAQPLIRQLLESPHFGAGAVAQLPEILPWFTVSRERYVAARAEEVRRNSALLTLDGWWVDLDLEPVHSACDSLSTCPHRDGWTEPWTRARIATYLEELPGDVIIVRLRCRV
ncbi:hypothetical protein ACFO1B_16555 [Dactylosporangium siamense]|uniref:Uncharacterized protein n=1 Tax=Dactylosporangium siamense TaxID=685454 RepID=A0A919PKK0_9ACTN|nr:hypothetical protein [Dactylosporangium siamense]GIG45454.1 hypothetical protein Dsi01nite_034950 [Dactylosporangium siamense]